MIKINLLQSEMKSEAQLKEERIAALIGKIGSVGGITSLALLFAVAVSTILTRFMNMEMAILSLISFYGPGAASVFGGASTLSTYYGWFRILRKKTKLSKTGEAKNEAQNQLGEFFQSLPDIIGSMFSSCFSQVSTVALGASLVASTATYTPVVEIITEKVKSAVEFRKEDKPIIMEKTEEKIDEEIILEEEEARHNIIGKLNIKSKEISDAGIEFQNKSENNALFGRRGGASGTIELLRDGVVVAATITDEEGNYAFMNMPPGEYSVRAKLEGYEDAFGESFALGEESSTQVLDLEMESAEEEEEEKEEPAVPIEMPSEDGMYIIQVGIYDSQRQAQQAVNNLAERGIKAYFAEVENPGLLDGIKYRVRIGYFQTIPGASSYNDAVLVQAGYKGWVDKRQNDKIGDPLQTRVPPPIAPTPLLPDTLAQTPLAQTPLAVVPEAPDSTPPPPTLPPEPKPMPLVEKPQKKYGFFAGLGSEVNSNAKKGAAIGNNMALGYDMNRHFALGLNAVYSNDMNVASTMESTLMFRYYLPFSGPFLQAEAGGMFTAEDGKNQITPLGGLTAGLRLGMDKNWFLEPAVRGNYPFVWGAGLTIGKRFGE